jgi:hypothetical protein
LTAIQLEKITRRFYSGENLDQLAAEMKRRQMDQVLRLLAEVESEGDLRKLIDIRVLPGYIDFQNREHLKLSLQHSWAENVERIEHLKAKMLTVQLKARPESETRQLVEMVRKNLELRLPLYQLEDQLVKARDEANTRIANFKRNKPALELASARARAILAGLRQIDVPTGDTSITPKITLALEHPDRDRNLLPLSMQVQAYEAEVVHLYENLAAEARALSFETMRAQFLAQLQDELKQQLEGQGHLQDFIDYLHSLPADENTDRTALRDAWLHTAANYQLAFRPLTHGVLVTPKPRGTIKITAMATMAAAMIGLFIAIAHLTIKKTA